MCAQILSGNILSVFVLSCPEMRSNFNQLLIALSVFDLLYLVMSLRWVPFLLVYNDSSSSYNSVAATVIGLDQKAFARL